MIRVRGIKIPVDINTKENIIKYASKKIGTKVLDYKIHKQSIDARNKNRVCFVYELDLLVHNEENIKFNDNVFIPNDPKYKYPKEGNVPLKTRPIIVGAGPAGLFCGYILAELGYKPIIIDRGEKIEDREKTVRAFLNNNILNINSNIQFGEGGAGTFSDGKLNTLVKDKNGRMEKVFTIFTSCGAPEDILYLNKPHIGTDILKKVIINIRNKIIKNGGSFKYNATLEDIIISDNKVKGIIVNGRTIYTDILVLAVGNSARDTFYMLNKYLKLTSKPFAVGIRIQHPQDFINKTQYGSFSKYLPPAAYKLAFTKQRGVYTFCMCPGGYVINASSEDEKLAINGMSNHTRDGENACSAIVVTVSSNDYGTDVFAGISFQRKLESLAYKEGKGCIPVQLLKDYMENNKSSSFGGVHPCFKGKYSFANINNILPDYINDSIKDGIKYFDTKIKGYNMDDAIISAVESRTSAPIRILRDDNLESNIKGIYPSGEGAGYAGGITTSAMDGIKIAEVIINKYSKPI